MRLRGAFKAAALLAAVLGTTPACAKDDPTFHVKEFKNYPSNVNYFDDSDVIIFHDMYDNNVYRSENAGQTWDRVEVLSEGAAYMLFMHEYDPKRAYILTMGGQHYRTSDRGKTWDQWGSDAEPSMFRLDILQFHADDPDRIIFNGMDCQSIFCTEVAMYTTDGFKTAAEFLRGNTAGCWWAKSSGLFSTTEKDLDLARSLCIIRDPFSASKHDQRLVISDNYFSAKGADGVVQEFEPDMDMDRPVKGVINIAVVQKYLLVATASRNTDEMALFVTDDTKKWHRAMFPTDHKINQEAYTVLESTGYSIQVDVLTSRPADPMGVIFTSNSNGTYFTRNIEHTNRNHMGNVDFEKISGVQGIFLVNKVDNWKAMEDGEGHSQDKKIVSEITFDDGRTFEDVHADGKRLHLHSVTDLSNVGRVFSSPAPGLVMGIGNTGDHLSSYWKGDLYVSDNAGKSWVKGLEGPHKYEFGDQGSILVAVKDVEGDQTWSVDGIQYSLDHGQTWKAASFPDGLKMKPWYLTTVQDSTSLKFILAGETKTGFPMVAIDFDGLHEATCKDSDLEDWFARTDSDGQPTCLMGHTQKYQRRKKNAECFLKKEFKDPEVETTDCECTPKDFECDYNFVRDGDDCVVKGPIVAPEEACKNAGPDDTFKGSSGWRLIPGNTCKRTGGEQKDDLITRKCSESFDKPTTPGSGKVSHMQHVFKGNWEDVEKHYLERGDKSSTEEETIIARPIGGKAGPISITHNHGKDWEEPKALQGENIWAIITHYFFKEMVFFVTPKDRVFYTVDRGLHFHSFKPPYPAAVKYGKMPLAFHPDKKDWLIWMGENCELGANDCVMEASISEDRGDHWKTISRFNERCEFTGSSEYTFRAEKHIVCLERKREDNDANNPLILVSSKDFFDEDRTIREENVKDFATMSEFIVVATENATEKTLQASASLDGETFAPAHFPYNFQVPQQHAYTVLDSSTHAVNLFVVTETNDKRKYGTIVKSNSNGTSYVMSVSGVNCDDSYYVDFEKMLGLEGVALVNIVANKDKNDEPKKLQTKITHSDGAQWAFMAPPKKDLDGKSFDCSSSRGDENCALHIHGYTERVDHRKTYSSENAVGIMFGWGNVGSSLGDAKDANTFMTTDAGVSWKEVKKGRWSWSFGDQGSIIVLVQTSRVKSKTNVVFYSVDEGATWVEYKFADDEIEITDITTLRSGASRNFLLWAKQGEEVSTINLDFSGLSDRPCKHPDDGGDSDYYIWNPKHPLQDSDCLFGHVSQYLRKKPEKQCFNGYETQHLYKKEDCECRRQDFECDYNFELDNSNQCKLVKGLQPITRQEWCTQNPGAIEFWEPSGYRKVPLSTCKEGLEMDKTTKSEVCAGHEDEYERAHSGLSGVAIFFAVIVPIALAGAVGWYVWRNWSGKFGQIRLGENGTSAFDSDQPWIKYPIIALSAVVAVVGAIPVVLGAVWRTAKGAAERWGWKSEGRGAWSRLGGGTRRFTTRDSFARGRGDYAVVDEDEGELLGEDSDEEV